MYKNYNAIKIITNVLNKDLYIEERNKLYKELWETDKNVKSGFKIIEKLGYKIEWIKHKETGKRNWLRITI